MSASEEVAAVGDTQRFECQVVGFPSPNVTWYKDEVDITNNPRYNIHYDKERGVIALTIRQVLPTDEGCYQCRAQNSEGYATTTAYLVVRVEHGLSRGFRSMLVSEKATEQETSQVQMASADKQRVFEEVITRVEETEKEVIEEKLFPPKLTYDRALGDGVQLKSGSTLYIEVGVSGIPFPDVTWHHGDAHLREDARLTMETESGYAYMKLKGTTQEDAGVYKVTAENTVGKDEASFNVTVKAPPSPPRNLRVTQVYKDYITIAWDKSEHDNGFPITGYIIEKSLSGGTFVSVITVLASEFEYKITRLYEGSEYMFRVMAENKIGVSQPATMEKPVKARLPFDPPGKPRGLAVTSVDKDAVGLRWEAPESDGGALITSYIVEKKDVSRTSSMWAIAGTVEGTKFEFLVPKLFTGNCYHFRVFAENRVGPGEPATLDDGVIAKLPYDKPMPARNIRAVETNVDYIVIEWDEPEHDGGSPITSYIIEKRDAKRREFIYSADVSGDVRTFKATRLFEGYDYFFRVFAENIVGASEPCEMQKPARAKLPYDEPLEPHNLRVTDYWTDFVSLQWDAPTSDGGSPLTGYVIEKRDALRQTWVRAGNVGPDVDNFKVTNLFEGTEYVFRVFAENKVGLSLKASELDKPVKAKMPFDAPFAPQSLSISDVNADRMTVSWKAPANDGGSAITRYIVEKRDAMRATWGACGYTEPGTTTLVIEGLIEGDNYFYRVAAENQVGRGEYVELVHPITAKLPYSKPEKPVGLRTTEIWSTYIALAWDAPKSDGGSPVTGYNIEVRDTMKAGFKFVASVKASTTSFQVTNLEEGHEYYFRVFAENKAGLSDAAAELKPAVKAQLPYNRPGAPSTIKVVGTGKSTISITWTVPETDGGSPITGYIVEICPALSTEYEPAGTVDASTTSFTVADLREGADYFVRVRSQNAAGVSKDATQTDVPICARAPKTAPSRPGAVSVKEVATDSLTVTWKVPETDGGAQITAYLVEIREVGGTFAAPVTVDGKTLSATLPGLSPDKAYEVQVSAQNPSGKSEPIMTSEPAKTKPKPVEVKPEEVKSEEVKPAEVKPVEDKPVEAEPAVKPAEAAAPAQLTQPSAPRSLHVTDAQPDAVTVAWKAPESDGGSPVAHYVVVIKDVATSKKYKKAGRVDCNTLSLRISDKIKKGHEYMIAVYAENAAGVSPDGAGLATPVLVPEDKPAIVEEVIDVVEQAPVEAAKPKEAPKPTEPAAPGNPRLKEVTSESITITWDSPANDGGAEVAKYTICVRDAEKKKFKAAGTVDGKTTSYTIDKVKESHEYFIRVYAENEVGISAEGEVTTSVKVPTKKTEDTVDAAKGPAPEIVSAPEPVEIKEGETIRLTCKVKGDPDPDVRWFKGREEIIPSRRNPRIKTEWSIRSDEYILTIMDATVKDAAMYKAEVTNIHGTTYKRAEAIVGDVEAPSDEEIEHQTEVKCAPSFIQQLKTSPERSEPQKATGKPIAKVPESETESDLSSDSSTESDSSDSSTLSSSLSDSSLSEVEMVKKTVAETVKKTAAEVVKEIKVEAVTKEKVGSTEVVEVKKEALPKQVKPVQIAETTTKVKEPTKDSSSESEISSSESESESESDSLTESEPEIKEVKQPVQKIKVQTEVTIEAETKPATKLPSAPEPETGKSTKPEPKREPADKAIKEPTPEPEKQPIPEPSLDTLMEHKKETTPKPTKEVTPEPVPEHQPTPIKEPTPEPKKEPEKFQKSQVETKSAPEVSSSESSSSSSEEEARVPAIIMKTDSVRVDVGSRIRLTCQVSGDPEPEVEWYKDGKEVKPKRSNTRVKINWDMKTDAYELVITDATEADAGEYVIKAINSEGTKEIKVDVDVGETRVSRKRQEMSVTESLQVIEKTKKEADVTRRVEGEGSASITAEISEKKKIPEEEPKPVEEVVVEEVQPKVNKQPEAEAPSEEPKPVEEVVVEEVQPKVNKQPEAEAPSEEPKPVEEVVVGEVQPKVNKQPEAKAPSEEPCLEIADTEATMIIEPEVTEETKPSEAGPEIAPKKEPEAKAKAPSEEPKPVEEVVVEEVQPKVSKQPEAKAPSEEPTLEIAETEATVVIEPETKPSEPGPEIAPKKEPEAKKPTDTEVSEVVETEIVKDVKSKISKTEVSEMEATITLGTTEENAPSQTKEKITTSVVTEVTKEAKITTETEVNAEVSEVSEDTEFTVTIETDTTEETKESEPVKEVTSSVVIEELETEIAKAPEATVSTEEETTSTLNADAAASFTLGEDTIEEITGKVKTEEVAAAMKVESPSSSEDEETEAKKEHATTTVKTQVISADSEVTEKVSATEETEATLIIEDVSEVSAESKSTETKVMTGVQKDVTQMTSGLQIVSIEGSEEEESDEEEKPKVVGVQKDVTQITSGLQIISIEGSEESSSEEEEEGSPPKFVQKPEPAVVDFGEEIRLVCKVSGEPEPEVTWFKGDKKLKQSKREPRLKIHWDMAQDLNILIITDATADDAGEYTVVAENDNGSFKFTVTVLVGKTEGMEITKTTESKRTTTVIEETTVDGEVVDRTVKQEVSEDTPEVTVEKTVVTEKPAEVVEVVQEEGAAPKFDKPPEPMLVDLGETIHLTCRATGDPEPEVTWYKDGELIKPSKRNPRIKTHWDFKEDLNSLTIKDAVKEDEGKYTVIADNKFGSFKFSVTVLVGKPAGAEIIKTTESKKSVTVVEETIVDGEVVDRTVKEDVSESEPTTVIETVKVEESAPVESAPKEEGKPPKFVQAPEPVFVDFGETVKLTCKVEGTPKPEVQWYKAKSKIETGDRSEVKYSSDDDIHMLIIIDATSDDAGEYTVIAENKFGSFKFTVTVLVGRPEGAEIVSKTIESKRSVKVIEETVVDGKVTQRVVQEDVSEDTPREQIVKDAQTLSHESSSSEAVKLSHEAIATEEVISSKAAFAEEDVQTEFVITLGEEVDSDKVHNVLEDTKISEETSTTSEVFTIGAEDSTKSILTQESTTRQTSSVTEATDNQNVLRDTVLIMEDNGEAPKFKQPPEPVFVDFGETVRLTCKVTGSPTPDVSWYRKGVPDKIVPKEDDLRVKPDFDEKQDLHILIILDATADDAGDYTVIAENKYGSFKFTVTVLVGRPEGAEIVTKTIESKRSVKVVEETVVDGKVVQRTVNEETSEEAPDTQTKVEKTLIVSKGTDTDSSSQMKVEESIVVSEDTSEVHATLKAVEITASDAVTIAATTTEVQKVEESATSELTETQKAVQSEIATEEAVTVKKAVEIEDKKKPAPKSEESSSEESSSEEESSEEEEEQKPGKETGEAPKFLQPPEPVFVDVGETIKLTCKTAGDPEPKVTWHRGDVELSTSGRFTVDLTDGTHTLTIKEATEEDAGDYKVRATNAFGTFNFTVTVLVGKPAGSRIVEMTRTTTSVKETIVDGEVVEHLEKEDVQTEKFDETDSQSTTKVETSETTTLKQEVLEDVVTEEKTEKVEAVKPTVDKSPKIDIPPEPVSVDEGKTIRLKCKVSGDPEPEVCWYKGQDVIKPTKRDTRIQANWDMSTDLNHLVVSEARPGDGGEYTMKAENEHGECSVTVIVKVGHQVEDKKQESVEEIVVEQVIEEGSVEVAAKEVTIEAATEQSEEVSATIQLDAPEEEESSAITKLSEVQENVSDTVQDSATMTAESVVTESVTVKKMTETVTETEETAEEDSQPAGAPKMEIAPKPVIVDVGETVEVTCKFSGDPEPEVEFYKDDKLIKNKKSYKRVRVDWNMKTDIYTLVIEDATAADSGDYVVKAENSHGLIQFTVSVVVGKAAETCVVETSRSVTVTEHTVVDGATTETVVHEETSTESSASGVTKEESTVTETVVQEVMDKPLKTEVPEITESVSEDVAKVTEVAETVTEDVAKVTEVAETVTEDVAKVTEVAETVTEDVAKVADVTETVTEDVAKVAEVVESVTEDVAKVAEVVESVTEEVIKVAGTVTEEKTSTETVLEVNEEKKKKAEEPMSEDSSEDSEASESGEEDDGAPTIEEAPVPVSVKLGETICLKCKVTGDPEPEVSWLRNDVEIKPKRHDKRVKIDWDMKQNLYILTITDATLEDAGEYAVKAENVNGGFTLKVTVVVSELTEKSTSVTTVETVESEKVESGTSEGFKTSQSTIVETSKSAVIETTESEVDVSGKSQMSVGKDGAPVLEEAPEPAVVPVGGTVRLTCRVTGDPDPTLTWFKGHMPVGLDDSDPRIQTIYDTVTKVSTLSIQRASIIDGGKYAVHAENSKGLIIVTVDVVVSDEITELVVDDHTSERTIHDDSELVGIAIHETSSRRKEGETEMSVEEIIARELAGAHSTVSQLMTSQSSQSSLETGGSAPTFELPPEPVSVMEGATIRLTCKVAGHPVPTVSWLRDGQSLDGELWDKRMNIDFMSSSGMHVLAIKECRLSDDGIYTVMSQNNHGSTRHTVSVHVGESDHALVCDEGDSALSFTRGKVTMKTTRFELSGDDDLHLNIGSDLSAAGILRDIAGDRAVEGYRQESTGGPGAPVIKRPPEPVSVAVGKTIRLTCLATGDPEPDVTWYKAGKQIKPRRLDRRIRVDWDMKTDEQFLEIRNSTEDDSGEYEMQAKNSKGSTSFTVSVHVGESGSAGATFERRTVQSSSSSSSSSMSSSSLLSDPMFSELSGSMRFSSKFS